MAIEKKNIICLLIALVFLAGTAFAFTDNSYAASPKKVKIEKISLKKMGNGRYYPTATCSDGGGVKGYATDYTFQVILKKKNNKGKSSGTETFHHCSRTGKFITSTKQMTEIQKKNTQVKVRARVVWYKKGTDNGDKVGPWSSWKTYN